MNVSKKRLWVILTIGALLLIVALVARPRLWSWRLQRASLSELEALANKNRNADDAELYAALGRALVRHGQPQRALPALLRVAQLRPQDARAHQELGVCLMYFGEYNKAREELEQASALDPRFQPTYTNLGKLYYELENYTKAITHLFKAVELNPNDVRAQYLLGQTALRLNTPDIALKAFRKLIAAQPQAYEGYLGAGQAHVDAGRLDEGEKMLQKSLALIPTNYETLHALGVLYLRRESNKGNYEKAISYFQAALKQRPQARLTYSLLGTCYEKLGRRDEAARAFEHTRRLDPNDIRVYYRLSHIYHDLGREAEARRMAAEFRRRRRLKDEEFALTRRMGATSPNPQLVLRLAAVWEGLGDYPRAYHALIDVINNRPENAAAHHRLSRVLIQLGRADEAAQVQRRARQLERQATERQAAERPAKP